MKLICGLFLLFSLTATADEVNYHQWEQLDQVAHDGSRHSGFLPSTIAPCNSGSAVIQQVFNYNLQEFKKNNSTARIMDTEWGKSSDNRVGHPASSTTFKFKPFETKAWVNFASRMTASLNYQVFNRSTEFLLTPKSTLFGINVGYSYLITSMDQKNLVSFRYNW